MPTVNLLTVKLLLNSIISSPGAKFLTIDIKNFYLNTPMKRFEYMRLKLSDLPEDFLNDTTRNQKQTRIGRSTSISAEECTDCPKRAY